MVKTQAIFTELNLKLHMPDLELPNLRVGAATCFTLHLH